MRRTSWSISLVGLAIASLAVVGGTTIGGDLGPVAAGYGILVALAALYALAGLAIRDRVWRRFLRTERDGATSLAGHRLF